MFHEVVRQHLERSGGIFNNHFTQIYQGIFQEEIL